MPWHLSNDHPDCSGWAVVKDSDNSVAGCHATKEKAQAQLAALYANEKENTSMQTKKFTAEVKAVPASEGGQPGEFEAIVAVFDNVDRIGDRVKSNAFDNTLQAWRESGDPIPVILSHQWDDPFAQIGYADPNNVKAIPGRGLKVKGQLDIGDNPTAAQVYRLMQRRTLKEFSFGYEIAEGGAKKAKDGAMDLTDLKLVEFGPTLKGLNKETELLSVKKLLEQEDGGKTLIDRIESRLEALQKAQAEMSDTLSWILTGKTDEEIETKSEEEEVETKSEEEEVETKSEEEEVETKSERDLELEHFQIQFSMYDSTATARDAELAEFEKALEGRQSLAGGRHADTAAERERLANERAAKDIQKLLEERVSDSE